MLNVSDQVIQYLDVAGDTVAYAVVGSGPPLVIGGWWCSHLALNWDDDRFRTFVDELAAHRTVVRYDRPGAGASGPAGNPPAGLEDEVEVLEALVRELDLGRVSIFGASSGAPVAAAYAARNPSAVDRLVLYGAFARGQDIAPPSARAMLVDLVSGHWGLGSRVLADLFLPGARWPEREEFARFQRRSMTKEQAAEALAATYELDVRHYLDHVTASTTVIHREHDRAVPMALGLDVAHRIRHARFVQLAGVDHFPWRGAVASVAATTVAALGHRARVRPPAPGPDAVTDREREVVRLVADGLTDAQIADRLTVSVHTVHRHVANVRQKLGVRSRAAAATVLAADV